jgi:thiosulfate/3-mercaptopyruvate sulfurtransferase
VNISWLKARALLPIVAGVAFAPLPRAEAPSVSLTVTTQWLADHLRDSSLVLLEIGGRHTPPRTEHIPNSRAVEFMAMIADVNGISHELPSPDSLRALFESVGVSDNSHIVLTGPNLAVTRAFYTLEYIGHQHVSVLDGGLKQWKKEGRPTEKTTVSTPARGHLTVQAHPEIIATTEWVRDHLGKPGVSLIDTRNENEYLGQKWTNGHIEGARLLTPDWFFTDSIELALKDRASLEKLLLDRVDNPSDTIVAYCTVGFRATSTYFVARLLGLPVKMYDGSYDAWTKQKLPLTKTPTPPKTSRT